MSGAKSHTDGNGIDGETTASPTAAIGVLLPLLACPLCHLPPYAAADGVACSKHGTFHRSGGILSFLPGQHSAFDGHWQQAAEVQRPQAKLDAARRFLEPIIKSDPGRRPRILDVGCGDGVHVEQLLAHDRNFIIAGVDYSMRALASASRITGEWLPVHADAQHLPFADGSFDVTISFGVQAYLDEPRRGLAEMVRVTKPEGLIGLWYAPRRRGVAGLLFAVTRGVVPHLPGWAQRRIADMMVPFLGLMPTSSTLSLRTGNWRECREVILVNIAPRHIAFPTASEIAAELSHHGCEIIARNDAIEGEYWARKKSR